VEDGKGLHLTSTSHKCWLDIDRERAERYSQKLAVSRDTAKKRLEGLQNRLSNKNYVHQAPKQLVEETKQQIVTTQTLIENIEKELARFA
jgi:valyl-tRNA synthetase